MGKQFIVERPWQRVYTDLLGPYPRSKQGNTHLLIVLDQFTKFVLLHPLRKADAASIVSFLEHHVFHLFGVPESIVSDNGSQYTSREFSKFLKKYDAIHTITAIYSPQANASERVNQSILTAIRAEINGDQQHWDASISSIGAALRNSIHDSISYSPFYSLFGHHMVQHGSVYKLLRKLNSIPEGDIEVLPPKDFRQLVHERIKENLHRAHLRNEKTYNLRSREVKFRPGQEIYHRVFAQSNFKKQFNAKLGKQWRKARILEKKGSCMYILEDMQGQRIPGLYHAKDIKQ